MGKLGVILVIKREFTLTFDYRLLNIYMSVYSYRGKFIHKEFAYLDNNKSIEKRERKRETTYLYRTMKESD